MSTSFDLNRTGILRNAFQMAGIVGAGEDPRSEQLAMGADFLNTRVKALQNEGIILVTVEQTAVTLTAGTASYALAADTLDVDIGTPFVTQANTSPPINIPLEWYSRAMYMALTVPSIEGCPSSIYVEKTSTIRVYLYPVPDSNWDTLTIPRIKLLDDLSSGGTVTGLQAKYLRTLVLGVAVDVATASGLIPRVIMLERQYEEAKRLATNDDTERGNLRFVPDYGHLGHWPRRY